MCTQHSWWGKCGQFLARLCWGHEAVISLPREIAGPHPDTPNKSGDSRECFKNKRPVPILATVTKRSSRNSSSSIPFYIKPIKHMITQHLPWQLCNEMGTLLVAEDLHSPWGAREGREDINRYKSSCHDPSVHLSHERSHLWTAGSRT